MFSTITVATDGSPVADAALAFASTLARRFGSRLSVVHVIDRLGSDLPVRRQVAELRAAGLPVRLTLVRGGGDEAEAIASLARMDGAELIVVGRSGTGLLARVTVGRVPYRLLRLVSCPVCVVPPSAVAATEAAVAAAPVRASA
jgi:nucleotide-binding universal stress UspA family protein